MGGWGGGGGQTLRGNPAEQKLLASVFIDWCPTSCTSSPKCRKQQKQQKRSEVNSENDPRYRRWIKTKLVNKQRETNYDLNASHSDKLIGKQRNTHYRQATKASKLWSLKQAGKTDWTIPDKSVRANTLQRLSLTSLLLEITSASSETAHWPTLQHQPDTTAFFVGDTVKQLVWKNKDFVSVLQQ